MRLQKYMALCGVASRRKSETMIAQGLVTVNGKVITAMGTLVESGDMVMVQGHKLQPPNQNRHIMLNKPQGVITTADDPEGRTTVLDLIGPGPRVFPVGRLDFDTHGLLLLTSDGALSHAITHPSKQVDKIYWAKVKGLIEKPAIRRLEEGMLLDDGHLSAPATVQLLERTQGHSILRITVHEGHNRLIRRMLEGVGHPVRELKREAFGPLLLGHLKPGQWRNLSPSELIALKRACGMEED